MRGLPLSRTTLKARYDSGELVCASPPADAKRQRVDDSTPAETAKFLRMLKTREQIRLAKAAGAPWPWSDDDVLNRHKFTNVKREHDRTTAWLRANWTAAHANADAAINAPDGADTSADAFPNTGTSTGHPHRR